MKILVGNVVSTKMEKTAVVEVAWKTAHPLYKKLLKRSRKYKVALNGQTVNVGDNVQIVETKKVAKDKYFKIDKILAQKGQATVAAVEEKPAEKNEKSKAKKVIKKKENK